MGRTNKIGSSLWVVIFLENGFFTGEFLMLVMLASKFSFNIVFRFSYVNLCTYCYQLAFMDYGNFEVYRFYLK